MKARDQQMVPGASARARAGTNKSRGHAVVQRAATRISTLQQLTIPQLLAEAQKDGVAIADFATRRPQDLVFHILRSRYKKIASPVADGTLEVLPDGFGFLRRSDSNYLPCADDIYISPSQIRRFGLRTGAVVAGQVRPPKDNERYFAMLRVESVNYRDPAEPISRTTFEHLTPLHPTRRFRLETEPDDLEMRVVDVVAPIGMGQRGLIVAPPRTGKTTLLQKLGNAILRNHPECFVIVLLIDERPEEVTEMKRLVATGHSEVISSTFDEAASRHIQVAELAIEKAKRLAESGLHAVILLDSVTRLARAYNTEQPTSGKILSGGVDAVALHKPKRFFGAARCTEESGSLTILATALVDTGSRMDDVIFEEFKGTGNMELHLDRRLVDRRVWPAVNVVASGTRKEELLVHSDELSRLHCLRRALVDKNPVEAMEAVLAGMKQTKSNSEFLLRIRVD